MNKPALYLSVLSIALVARVTPARAGDPSFEKGKKDDKQSGAVEWKASSQAGLIVTTGNSKTTTFSAGASASRKAGFNKLQLAANAAFARSSLFLASDTNGDGFIEASEIDRPSRTTTRSWGIASRYDRFLTESNALYVLAKIGADKPAGKQLIAGGQAGYSRRLLKNDNHELLGEAGYDFTFEDFDAGDGVAIHSARLFIGYTGKISDDTGVKGATELLVNANSLDAPGGTIDALEDIRITSSLELATKLLSNVSFSFGFTAKWDNAPAPRPSFGVPYTDGFVPLADKLDTTTKASLIVNFL